MSTIATGADSAKIVLSACAMHGTRHVIRRRLARPGHSARGWRSDPKVQWKRCKRGAQHGARRYSEVGLQPKTIAALIVMRLRKLILMRSHLCPLGSRNCRVADDWTKVRRLLDTCNAPESCVSGCALRKAARSHRPLNHHGRCAVDHNGQRVRVRTRPPDVREDGTCGDSAPQRRACAMGRNHLPRRCISAHALDPKCLQHPAARRGRDYREGHARPVLRGIQRGALRPNAVS